MNDFPETPKATNAGALGANASHGADASLGSNASHGTAEAAAMREAEMWRRQRRDRRKASEGNALSVSSGILDSAQTVAILSLAERIRKLESAGSGYDMILQDAGGGGGDHPFRVIDASDGEGPKVRVLPGICNFSFPTVAGQPNEWTTAAEHEANAPRIVIPSTGYVAFLPSGSTPPFPASVNIGFSATFSGTAIPLAKVTVTSGVISEIRQLIFDSVSLVALDYGGGDIRYALS